MFKEIANVPRKYEKKKRKANEEETRQRIVEATVDLHQSLGPAQTTITAIAEHAGVQRLTVYRHFPDNEALFSACTRHYFEVHPMPNPESWREIADPVERFKHGLAEVFDFFAENQQMLQLGLRDLPFVPEMGKVSPFGPHWAGVRQTLAEPWEADGEAPLSIVALVHHATDFHTWNSLVQTGGLSHEHAIDLLACLIECEAPR